MTLNPELQILTLQHNKISQIGSASFQFHPELLQVDLSHNGLETVQVLDMEHVKVLLRTDCQTESFTSTQSFSSSRF